MGLLAVWEWSRFEIGWSTTNGCLHRAPAVGQLTGDGADQAALISRLVLPGRAAIATTSFALTSKGRAALGMTSE